MPTVVLKLQTDKAATIIYASPFGEYKNLI